MPAVATATQAKAEEATRTGPAMAESHELGPAAGALGRAGAVLGLQRAVGNRAVGGALQRTCACERGGGECADCKRERESGVMQRMALSRAPVGIQAKLTINEPGDRFEQEADRVAEAVVGGGGMPSVPETDASRLVPGTGRLGLQRLSPGRAGSTASQAAPPSVRDALQSSGQPLEVGTRAFMEPRFGHDFGDVRVHTDARAAESARAVNAVAYTVGRDVVFGAGRYAPGTGEGRRLLAHELAHVVQQTASVIQSASAERRNAPYTGNGIRFPAHVNTPREASESPQIFRQVRPAEAHTGAAPPVDRSDPAMFAALLEALDQVGELRSSGYFSLKVRGQSFEVTTEQIIQLRQTATRAIQRAASRVLMSAEGDLEGYAHQHQVNEDQKVVSTVVQFFGHVQDPGPKLKTKVSAVRAAHEEVRAALSASRLADALRTLESAERTSQEAHHLWRGYHEGIISAAEGTVRGLTFTRDASFVTLGVLAVIASGGAATTTVLGLNVGTTSVATGVAVGAPIVARLGEAGVRAGIGEQVDWTRVAVDTAVDLVLVRLGGRLSQGLFQRLGGNPAVRSLGPDLARRVFVSVFMHEGTTAFRVIVDATYRRLRGQPVTWEQFGNALLDQMTDPRGLFIAALMGAVQTAADRRHGTPREFDVRNREGRPVADIDEMRGGTLYEDKNAAGIDIVPPGRTRPQQTEAQWAEHSIYTDTVRRVTGIPASGATTARGRQPGSTRTTPTLAEVQAARRYIFRIESDNPALRAAVGEQLGRLRVRFPDWTFDAIFGYRPIRQ